MCVTSRCGSHSSPHPHGRDRSAPTCWEAKVAVKVYPLVGEAGLTREFSLLGRELHEIACRSVPGCGWERVGHFYVCWVGGGSGPARGSRPRGGYSRQGLWR